MKIPSDKMENNCNVTHWNASVNLTFLLPSVTAGQQMLPVLPVWKALQWIIFTSGYKLALSTMVHQEEQSVYHFSHHSGENNGILSNYSWTEVHNLAIAFSIHYA